MWFKVDDKLWGHPKWLATPPRSRALWITAGSWSAERLTDGFIPRAALPALGGTAKDADGLVKADLWHVAPGGWKFHEWTVYQPDAASEKAKLQAASDDGIRGNHNRWHVKRGIVAQDCPYCNGVPLNEPPMPREEQEQHREPDRVPDRVGVGSGIGFVSPEPVPDKDTHLERGNSPKQATPKTCPHGRPNGSPCGACADARRMTEQQKVDDERRKYDARIAAEKADAARRQAEKAATLAIPEDKRRQAAKKALQSIREALAGETP